MVETQPAKLDLHTVEKTKKTQIQRGAILLHDVILIYLLILYKYQKLGSIMLTCQTQMCACLCVHTCYVLRVVHVFRAREGFKRPVEEAVDEDEASTHRPHYQDSNEVYSQVIDHLSEINKNALKPSSI